MRWAGDRIRFSMEQQGTASRHPQKAAAHAVVSVLRQRIIPENSEPILRSFLRTGQWLHPLHLVEPGAHSECASSASGCRSCSTRSGSSKMITSGSDRGDWWGILRIDSLVDPMQHGLWIGGFRNDLRLDDAFLFGIGYHQHKRPAGFLSWF